VGTEDKRRQFDEIVAHLTAEEPALARTPRRWSRSALTTMMVVGGVLWGLLSVTMVAWGTAGVVLTLSVVALAVIAAVIDEQRHRPRARRSR
jgi:uncharacterized membrane protein